MFVAIHLWLGIVACAAVLVGAGLCLYQAAQRDPRGARDGRQRRGVPVLGARVAGRHAELAAQGMLARRRGRALSESSSDDDQAGGIVSAAQDEATAARRAARQVELDEAAQQAYKLRMASAALASEQSSAVEALQSMLLEAVPHMSIAELASQYMLPYNVAYSTVHQLQDSGRILCVIDIHGMIWPIQPSQVQSIYDQMKSRVHQGQIISTADIAVSMLQIHS